jgi:ribosome assembly protein YihI (activator of Der GTPase)
MTISKPTTISTRITFERKEELEFLKKRLGVEKMSALIDLALEELIERSTRGSVYTIKEREFIDQALQFIKEFMDTQKSINKNSSKGEDANEEKE